MKQTLEALKKNAYNKIHSLFANGNISNSEFHCAICISDRPIHKHHENYELWFSFIPLCHECHAKLKQKELPITFNYGKIENLTIMRDTGIREHGHIVWLARDKFNNKYKIRTYANKIIEKTIINI